MNPAHLLDFLLAGHWLRPIDVQAAQLLERIDQGCCPQLLLAAAFASWATGQGHTCLPLSVLPELLAAAGVDNAAYRDSGQLRVQLLRSTVVGAPGDLRPLILDADNHLFLHRLYRDETVIARALSRRAAGIEAVDQRAALPLVEALFPESKGAVEVDWQRAAAVLALHKRLVIISGGPGTGKTYTVARMLALLIALTPTKPRIALAAPTGKAALRLRESIRRAKDALPPLLATPIPEQAQTLHRLLGVHHDRPGFRHHGANPLHLDLLILDEASMIDVPLMAALLAALPAACRVILLGDRDQLASVEAGNLFGDLCGEGAAGWSARLIRHMRGLLGPRQMPASVPLASSLGDCLVLLHTSRRFHEGSGIGTLARAVNSGAPEAVAAILDAAPPDLHIEETHGAAQTPWLRDQIAQCFLPLFAADTPLNALRALGQRRILCALREGPGGVEGINRLAETIFRRLGRIATMERFYRGMPILIQRNDYGLGLFNGDTGILWPDDQGRLQAWFAEENGEVRPVSLARLPSWQVSYAITVHKAQGSEFDEVLLLLPQEDAPVLSRELLYTGITRARRRFSLFGPRALLLRAVRRRLVRYSGLAGIVARIGGHPPGEEATRAGAGD
ncbi:exodeoxyribonuclease V, alpha subunit [Desulfobulbus propionicus DSM 2032]|uniref:Exodeoxyribonuclease V, alpha subunit n=1 Tax=Desulfobulbus propionicus (strain ATCC 33891 / DSM 2032 / VKM B-1956 / 1pr3) TaxID=577650 RepID=A0A7U3YNY8_DESPD|nr:exodeoxyribonuclease V subunit alpha [Desulfobulbus propionicus]ADW18875.1 exodeoxyribonuclease V, alpha subunit [Desulfobulbus propionicus DSM 2032]